MAAIVTEKFRIYAAQKFIAGLADTSTNNIVYMFIGKTLPWTNVDAPGVVTAINVTAGGSGYTEAPTVVISGGGGFGAVATATITSGAVTAITIVTPGQGFTSVPTVAFSSGSAAATAVINGGASDTTPPFPIDTVASHVVYWQDMMHLKRVSASNASLVILRFDWISGIIYQQYDQNIDLLDPTLGIRPYYILTTDLNVYKCLYNNNGTPSSVMPTGTSTNTISTSDGYFWKYMYTVNQASAEKFLTPEWVPVTTIIVPDNSSQFDVQQSAVDGALDVIQVVNGGFGYVHPPIITITGNGTGATATSQIESGQVTSIILTNRGTGYSEAVAVASGGQVTAINILSGGSGYVSAPTVAILGGGGSGATATATLLNGAVNQITITAPGSGYTSSPAVTFSSGSATAGAIISGGVILKPIIGPPGGHGSDPTAELGGYYAMIDGQFNFNEGGFTVVNDFRRVGLVLNPTQWETDTVAIASTASQAYSLTFSLTTGSDFALDEKVTGQLSGAVGYTLDYDNTNKILRLVNVIGVFQPGETISNTGASKTGLLRSATGTAQAAGAFEITLASGDTSTTGAYRGSTIYIVSGSGVGQQRIIANNVLASSNTVTITEDWDVTPNNTSVYDIANINYPDFQPNSGYIMYVENRRPVLRSSTQLEDIKMVAEF